MPSLLFALLGTSVVLAPAAASAAPATPITCGQVVTDDVVLETDLPCGFSIGADGVTVDLAGHTISDGSISIGRSHVTITGGTILRGSISVFAPFGSELVGLTIRDMTFREAPFAAVHASGRLVDSVIERSQFVANRTGLFGTGSGGAGLHVTDSEFRNNGSGVALIFNGNGYRFTANRFIDNSAGVSVTEAGGQVFRGNEFVGNTYCGYCSFIGGANELSDNTFRANRIGLEFQGVFSMGNVVDGNRFFENGVGLRLGSHGQITSQLAGAVVSGNVFVDNRGAGLEYLGSLPAPTPRADPVVRDNRAIRNGSAPVAGSAITSGIYVLAGATGPPVVVASNVANGNAGYGIEGYGVVDGGGNHAAHNGNPAQCLGVSCSRRS